MKSFFRILLVGATEEIFNLVRNALQSRHAQFSLESMCGNDRVEQVIVEKFFNVILYCYKTAPVSAKIITDTMKNKGVDCPLILICTKISDEVATYALKSGVHNVVTSFDSDRLVSVIETEILNMEKIIRNRSTDNIRDNSEGKYLRLLESIDDVFFALDMNLRCVYWNKAAEKLTRVTSKSALLKPLNELFPNETSIEIEDALYKAMVQKQPITQNVTIVHESRKCNHQMSIYPSKYGVSILSRESPEDKITRQLEKTQEQMNLQLLQSQELRILGQLTSGVAHEVRNPLNAISVVTEALFQDLGENPDFTLYKEHIFTHVDRLKRLMQDLLELGKPMEPSKVVNLYSLDLLRESVALWKSSGSHETFTVVIENNGDKDISIRGNPLKLQQVFMNILENASQHSPEGSLIRIIRTYDEKWCTIKIEDHGTGIKPEYLKHMFEPFFTTRKRGTGLGLAIVKHIVEVHGGCISICNNPGESGCTVEVKLPVFEFCEIQDIVICQNAGT